MSGWIRTRHDFSLGRPVRKFWPASYATREESKRSSEEDHGMSWLNAAAWKLNHGRKLWTVGGNRSKARFVLSDDGAYAPTSGSKNPAAYVLPSDV